MVGETLTLTLVCIINIILVSNFVTELLTKEILGQILKKKQISKTKLKLVFVISRCLSQIILSKLKEFKIHYEETHRR